MNAQQNAEQKPLTDSERNTLREWAALMGNRNLNAHTACAMIRADQFEQIAVEASVKTVLAECKSAGPVEQSELTQSLARQGWIEAARLSAAGAGNATIRAACPDSLRMLPGLNARLA